MSVKRELTVQQLLVSFAQNQRYTLKCWRTLLNCLKICISIARTQSNRKCCQCWVLVTFWKPQKFIPRKKNQSLLIAKISSRKTTTKKNTNPKKKKLSRKFRATRYYPTILIEQAWSVTHKACSLSHLLSSAFSYKSARNCQAFV